MAEIIFCVQICLLWQQKNVYGRHQFKFFGHQSPNPFWLASAPPTDKQINVLRAFEAGWGGVVWKTLGSQVKNVSSRYSAVDYGGKRVMGFNNIELISDRPLALNLQEIRECIRLFPDRAMVVSLMADNDRQSWHDLIAKVEDTGAHGFELNFGCPHGMTSVAWALPSGRILLSQKWWWNG